MYHWRAISLACLVLVGGAGLAGPLGAQATPEIDSSGRGTQVRQAELVRRVARERGRRLESLLRATDTVVEVIDEQPYGLAPPPPPPGYPGHGKPELQRRVEATPFIALVKVETQQGALTAVGDWIETVAQSGVRRAFKAPPGQSAPGHLVSLKAWGGEVRIGRQLIRARHHSASYLENGAEYLVWAWTDEGIPLRADWYLVDGNALVSVATGSRQDRTTVLAAIAAHVAAEQR